MIMLECNQGIDTFGEKKQSTHTQLYWFQFTKWKGKNTNVIFNASLRNLGRLSLAPAVFIHLLLLGSKDTGNRLVNHIYSLNQSRRSVSWHSALEQVWKSLHRTMDSHSRPWTWNHRQTFTTIWEATEALWTYQHLIYHQPSSRRFFSWFLQLQAAVTVAAAVLVFGPFSNKSGMLE